MYIEQRKQAPAALGVVDFVLFVVVVVGSFFPVAYLSFFPPCSQHTYTHTHTHTPIAEIKIVLSWVLFSFFLLLFSPHTNDTSRPCMLDAQR